jgi:phage FluMu gp28-like protein
MKRRKEKFFLPFQRDWLQDQSPLKIMQKSRQIGASFVDAYDSVKKAGAHDARYDVWVSSRDETQARLYLEDCARWANWFQMGTECFDQMTIRDPRDLRAYVLQFASGRRIYCLSSNPNALAGKRGHVKLDEFALHQDQRMLYRVAKPLTQWGGTLSIISTHRGSQTIFNNLIRDITEHGNPMGWSLHTVPLQKAVGQGLVEKINAKSGSKDSRENFIARLHAQCIDQEQWLQEYCCTPADESTTFITFDMLTSCEEPELQLLTIEELERYLSPDPDRNLNRNPNPNLPSTDANDSSVASSFPQIENQKSKIENPFNLHPSPLNYNPSTPISFLSPKPVLFLGLDVARKHDLCVFDVGEKVGDVVWDRLRIEMRGCRFAEIEETLYRLLRLRQVKRACIDATGLGAQLAERAAERFEWKVEPITFTAPMKEELAFGLRADFEERRLRIVSDAQLVADLRGIKKEVSGSGNIRFLGESGDSHCDRFWAKALRQHAARYRVEFRAVVG